MAVLVDDLEGEKLRISLHRSIVELATDESFDIEHGVLGVGGGLVLRGIADQALFIQRIPRDVRWSAGICMSGKWGVACGACL